MMSRKAHPTWYAFCRWFMRVFFYKALGGFESIGSENMPKTGPVLVAPIHLSHVDPPAVACGTSRRLRFMSKEELFHQKILGPLIRSLGAFPVKRGEGDTESIRFSMELLESGEALLIFPEGTRGMGDHMLPINRGIAMMAKRTKAKVVPVGLVGTNKKLKRGEKKLTRAKVTVIYGEPFTYEEVATSSSEKENRELFAAELANRISKLCRDHGLPVKANSNA